MISSTLMTWNRKKTRTKTSVIRQRLWMWWEIIWNHLWPSTHTPKFEVVQQRSHLICLSGTCLIKTQQDAQVSPKGEALSWRKTKVAQNGYKLRIFPVEGQYRRYTTTIGVGHRPLQHAVKKLSIAMEKSSNWLWNKCKNNWAAKWKWEGGKQRGVTGTPDNIGEHWRQGLDNWKQVLLVHMLTWPKCLTLTVNNHWPQIVTSICNILDTHKYCLTVLPLVFKWGNVKNLLIKNYQNCLSLFDS